MNNAWILSTAVLVILVGMGHSWLGEQKILKALLAVSDPQLPPLRKRFLRAGWHIGSVSWFALAAVLLCLGLPIKNLQAAVLAITALIFLLFGAVNFLISRGRNIGWVGCLAIAATAGIASSLVY